MYSILSVICFLLIIFSGSRGAGVALIVSICAWGLFLVVNYRSNIRKGFQRVFIVISIFLAGGIVFFFDRIYQYYVSRFSYLFSDAPGGTAVEARYDLSNQAIALISNSPIWGWGIGSFGALTGENYPHNFSLEILSEMGIIGYVLLIIVIISVLSALLKIPRYVGRNDQVKSIRELEYIFVFLFISFVFFIVAVHFSGDLYDSRWLFFLWGMVIAVARIKKKILYDPDFHKGGAGN